MEQRKLIIVSNIRKKHSQIYSKLFPYLCYKYLVIIEARLLKSKYLIFIYYRFRRYNRRPWNLIWRGSIQNLRYFMIYLLFLKKEDFDPEHNLRIKLFWDCSKESERALQSNQSWMWIYGIKSSQIKGPLQSWHKNDERTLSYLRKDWAYEETDNKFILNENHFR